MTGRARRAVRGGCLDEVRNFSPPRTATVFKRVPLAAPNGGLTCMRSPIGDSPSSRWPTHGSRGAQRVLALRRSQQSQAGRRADRKAMHETCGATASKPVAYRRLRAS